MMPHRMVVVVGRAGVLLEGEEEGNMAVWGGVGARLSEIGEEEMEGVNRRKNGESARRERVVAGEQSLVEVPSVLARAAYDGRGGEA